MTSCSGFVSLRQCEAAVRLMKHFILMQHFIILELFLYVLYRMFKVFHLIL
jgi:hypothetical protein